VFPVFPFFFKFPAVQRLQGIESGEWQLVVAEIESRSR